MSHPPNSIRTRNSFKLLALGFLALLVLGFIAYRIASNSSVEKQVAALRAKKLPVDEFDLDKWYRNVPARDNAALAFLDANALYVAPANTNNPSDMKNAEMVVGEPLPTELFAAIESLVGQNRTTIDELHKAAALTQSRYPINLTRGFATLLPHLAQLKRLSQLLRWEAVLQANENNRPAAVQALNSGFALAASLENEPLLISDLVRITIIQQLLPALEWLLTHHQLTSSELQTLSAALQHAEEQGKLCLQRVLAGERAAGLPLFSMNYKTYDAFMGGGGGNGGMPGEFPDLLKLSLFELRRAFGVTDADKSFYISTIESFENALELDYPEMLSKVDYIDSTTLSSLQQNRMRYLVSGMMLPSLEKSFERDAINTAYLRCARIALAIEQFRLGRSTLPTLADLTPKYLAKLPKDPVNGEPLEYEKLSKGYRIHAYGAPELNTNQGKNEKRDVSFTVLR